MKIEALTQPHAEAARQIYNHYIIHSIATPELIEQSSEEFESKLKDFLSAYVATDETGVIGFAFATPYAKAVESFDSTVDFGVYLRDDKRGGGIGKLLIEELIRDMKACRKHAAIAKIASENVASIKFFQELGFSEAARLNEIGVKFGRRVTAIYMQLML
jgi:L-amino acid N-acyltransferase YncA